MYLSSNYRTVVPGSFCEELENKLLAERVDLL
jgi:hypothetical protein